MNRARALRYLRLVILSLPFGAESTAAAGDYWVSGMKGGIQEAHVTSGIENWIIVSCGLVEDPDDVGDDNIHIYFQIDNNNYYGDILWLKFDNKNSIELNFNNQLDKYNTNICSAIKERCNEIISLFKSHKTVTITVDSGRSVKFTLRGASKAIPNCRYEFKKQNN